MGEGDGEQQQQQQLSYYPSGEAYFSAIYPVAQHEEVELKAKTLADMMESIIGGFYAMGGLAAGASVIKALGAWPKLQGEEEHVLPVPPALL